MGDNPNSENKYIGYVLFSDNVEESEIRIIKPALTAENLNELSEITEVVFFLQPITFAFEIVTRNYSEWNEERRQIFRDIVALSKSQGLAQRWSNPDWYIAPSQRLTNFLASAYSFLENSEQSLKDDEGNNGTKLGMWNDFRRARHKESFAYRLLYDLRTYSQHYRLPISVINAKVKDILSDDNVTAEFRMGLNRDALIETKGNFIHANVKDEIKSQDKVIQIEPLVDEYYLELRAICRRFVEMDVHRLRRCESYLRRMYEIFKIPGTALPVIFDGLPKRTDLASEGRFNYQLDSNLIDVPVQQFFRIAHLFSSLSIISRE